MTVTTPGARCGTRPLPLMTCPLMSGIGVIGAPLVGDRTLTRDEQARSGLPHRIGVDPSVPRIRNPAVPPGHALAPFFLSFVPFGEVITMANLAACVRITTRQSAVWRACAACAGLKPMAPHETHCRACSPSTGVRRAKRRS